MITIKNYIGGQLLNPIQGHYLDNYNPANGQVFAQIPDSTEEDLEMALRAAEEAQPSWSALSINDRSHILQEVANLIEANLDRLANAESLDSGKPLKLARTVDIPRSVANFRFFASAIVNFGTEAHIMETEAVNYTRRGALGVVGCISPWNLPLYLFTWKIAPALATGNCVIAKPSEITPYTAHLLGELLISSGLPRGVLNILHGRGGQIGDLMVKSARIKAISFTGGTSTGRVIGIEAAKQFKKVSLELGGKNPVLIFDDCDLDKAVETTVKSAFTNQGEICLCGSRIFVQKKIYQAFKDQFVKSVEKLSVGDPVHEETDLGALVSEDHLYKVAGFVDRAKEDGGHVLTGGTRLDRPGYFYQPTVIEGLDEYCEINQQEVFGPVVTLVPFEDEQDAARKANATNYGLACVIWTNDLTRAHRLAHQIQSGIVWVNCWMLRDLRTPFGGVKNSGIGREGGNEALRFFTEPQNVCIKL